MFWILKDNTVTLNITSILHLNIAEEKTIRSRAKGSGILFKKVDRKSERKVKIKEIELALVKTRVG